MGGSVAKAKEASVSIIRFTHNICTAFKGESWESEREQDVTVLTSFIAATFITFKNSLSTVHLHSELFLISPRILHYV